MTANHGTTTRYYQGCRCSACLSARATYLREWRRRPRIASLPRAERFWQLVKKTDSCWLFIGSTANFYGYGSYWDGKRMSRAHRYSWELINGPIPDGLFVCHKCDVTACVRPDHLFLGTNRDNLLDASRKGRTARQRWPERYEFQRQKGWASG